MKTLLFLGLGFFSVLALGATKTESTQPGKVKYRQGKDLSFDSKTVEGQIYRPDLSVVTGDTDLEGEGLLRLRSHFMDRLTSEAGGELK